MRAAKVVIVEVCLFVCLLAAAGAVPAYAAGPKRGGPNRSEVEGRKHARKANQLADVNKCKAAIPEYTKAMRLLKDPTLLFNRGECYRRTGEANKAIADYRKFLIQLPSAPNRTLVESQISVLEHKKAAPAAVAAAPAINPPLARVVSPKPAAAEPASSIESPPPPAPVAEERHPVELVVPEPEPELAPSLRAPPPAPAPVESPGPMAIVSTKPATSPAADTQSSSSYWWIWVLGAVVVVGAGAGAYFALKQGGTDVPPSGLGNYRF